MVISPFSVANALALLTIGTNGKTFNELARGLHFPGNKNAIANQFYDTYRSLLRGRGKAQFSVNNVVYVQRGYQINKNFKAIAKNKFNSGIDSLDFRDGERASSLINYFVEFKTKGKIKQLITPDVITSDTHIILLNAIYFKGEWLHQFDETNTRKSDFHVSPMQIIPVDFMYVQQTFNTADLPELGANAIEMKYDRSQYSFVIVLPYSMTGLSEMEPKLHNINFRTIIDRMRMDEVDVSIPKFKIEFDINLNQVLKDVSVLTRFVYVLFHFPLMLFLCCSDQSLNWLN